MGKEERDRYREREREKMKKNLILKPDTSYTSYAFFNIAKINWAIRNIETIQIQNTKDVYIHIAVLQESNYMYMYIQVDVNYLQHSI